MVNFIDDGTQVEMEGPVQRGGCVFVCEIETTRQGESDRDRDSKTERGLKCKTSRHRDIETDRQADRRK